MLLLYGVTGFSGALVARELGRRGVPYLAAGRRPEAVAAFAQAAGVEARAFALDDAGALGRALDGVRVVLNCAGPFALTGLPLARACADRGVHYLDLAGEVDEHLALHALGPHAAAHGAMLLPGVGFGVVPTELAAARAAAALGEPPARLVIAYETAGGVSRGTLQTVLGSIHQAGVVRRDGALEPLRPAAVQRRLDLGGGAVRVVANPWRADLVSAHASTGAPIIETYATFPLAARAMMHLPRLMGSRLGQWIIRRIISSAPEGPSEDEMRRGHTRVLAIAEAEDGRRAEVRVRGPEAYVFTAIAAAAVAERVLAGAARPGFATPSQLLGSDALAGFDGVEVTP